jgi:hypothetical protein
MLPPPLSPRNHLQGVRPKRSLSSGLPSTPPRHHTVPPTCARNTTPTLRRASTASRRQNPPSSMRRGHAAPPENHHYPVSAPKTMPPAGRTVSRVAIIRSRRPRSGVSPEVAPSPVEMCSKTMPSRGVTT